MRNRAFLAAAAIVMAAGCATKAGDQRAYDVATQTQTAEIRITGTRIKRRVRTDGRDPGLGIPVKIVTKEEMESARGSLGNLGK